MKVQISKAEALAMIVNAVEKKLNTKVDDVKIMYLCDGHLCEIYENIACFEVELSNSQHGLTDTTQTAIDVAGQGAKNLCVKVSNPSADTHSDIKDLIDKDYVKITICPNCRTKLGSNPSCFSCQGYATSSLVGRNM